MLRIFHEKNLSGLPSEAFPVTVDVSSLYTCIPTDGANGGLQAFEKAMDRRSDKTVPTWYLITLLREVLVGNIFEWNDQFWVQRIGTAMGTMAAPTYACLFMAWLEDEVILKNWTGTKPLMYRRFIDDIFFVWTGSVEELSNFLTHMNTQHDYIKFTSNYNVETKSVPFLDMTVSIENGQFVTDLYKKETSICQYLLPSSCHPAHQSKNIPFSLAFRLRRICSREEDFEKRLDELKCDLLSRQYHPKIIKAAFDRIRLIPRLEAIQKVVKPPSDRKILALTYHPTLPSVSSIVKKHWSVMTSQSNILKRCFPQPPMVAYRRAKNLREHLVKAKITSSRRSTRIKDQENGYKPCQDPCQLCWISESATTHDCKRTKQSWTINAPLDCNSEDVVYKLRCRKCPPWLYIGETGRRFRDRMQDHRGYITQKKLDHPVGAHFNLPGHSVSDLLPVAIERVLPKGNDLLRKRREKYWINKYDSITFGANTKD